MRFFFCSSPAQCIGSRVEQSFKDAVGLFSCSLSLSSGKESVPAIIIKVLIANLERFPVKAFFKVRGRKYNVCNVCDYRKTGEAESDFFFLFGIGEAVFAFSM